MGNGAARESRSSLLSRRVVADLAEFSQTVVVEVALLYSFQNQEVDVTTPTLLAPFLPLADYLIPNDVHPNARSLDSNIHKSLIAADLHSNYPIRMLFEMGRARKMRSEGYGWTLAYVQRCHLDPSSLVSLYLCYALTLYPAA